MALIRKSSRLSRNLLDTNYTNFINGKGADLKTLDVVNNTKGFAVPIEVNATNPSVNPHCFAYDAINRIINNIINKYNGLKYITNEQIYILCRKIKAV